MPFLGSCMPVLMVVVVVVVVVVVASPRLETTRFKVQDF